MYVDSRVLGVNADNTIEYQVIYRIVDNTMSMAIVERDLTVIQTGEYDVTNIVDDDLLIYKSQLTEQLKTDLGI